MKKIILLTIVSALISQCQKSSSVSTNKTVNIVHSAVKEQSISNCWIYAVASWVESLHLKETGKSISVSKSYWTYIDWYLKLITNEGLWDADKKGISTDGSYYTMQNIIRNYGVLLEEDFIKADTQAEASAIQASAKEKIDYELLQGRLKTIANRNDRQLVKLVLDQAWELPSDTAHMLTNVFGDTLFNTFERQLAKSQGSPILNPKDFNVVFTVNRGVPPLHTDLLRALREWDYIKPFDDQGKLKSEVVKSFQRAVQDELPVIVTWIIDFNALEESSINLKILYKSGNPGDQGVHMTVVEDYQVRLTDASKTVVIKAGQTLNPKIPEDKKLLDLAVINGKIDFIRMKNSWGTSDGVIGLPGYHDVYMDYLIEPFATSSSCPDGFNSSNCKKTTQALRSFIMPKGYMY